MPNKVSKPNQGYSSIYSLVMDRIIESTPLFYGFVLLLQAIPGLHYTDLRNNRAANLINFWGKLSPTHPYYRPTRLLFSKGFPSKANFHLHKWEKTLPIGS